MKSFRPCWNAVAAAIGLTLAVPAFAADIAKLEEVCITCHGKDGASADSEVPVIGGMSATYIEFNLNYYKRKERPCPEATVKSGPDKGRKTTMCEVTKDLSDSDISQLASLYAGRKFVRASQQSFDPELAKRGKELHQQYCEKCHLNDGSDPKFDAGILAGQWTPYLRKTFQEFNSGERKMEQKMKPKIKKLAGDDFEALLNYYASFK